MGNLVNPYILGSGVPPNTDIFHDNFDDNSLDGAKWDILNGTAGFVYNETNQRLEVDVTGGSSGVDALVTANSYDLTDRCFQVEAIDLLSVVSGVQSYFVAIDAGGDYFGFVKTFTTLTAQHSVGGSPSNTNIVYDGTQHHNLRLRHSSLHNALYWETSPDAVVWTNIRTVSPIPAGLDITSMKMRLQLNFSDGTTRKQIWDNFRLYDVDNAQSYTKPVAWTLKNTTGGNAVDDSNGAIRIVGNYWWITCAHSNLRTLSQGNRLIIEPNASSESKGGWGVSYDRTSELFVQDLPFCWHRKTTGNWQVWESGVTKYDSGSTAYEIMEIDVLPDGSVLYYRNGSLVYTSVSTVTQDFFFKTVAGAYAYDPTFTTLDYSYGRLVSAKIITSTLDWAVSSIPNLVSHFKSSIVNNGNGNPVGLVPDIFGKLGGTSSGSDRPIYQAGGGTPYLEYNGSRKTVTGVTNTFGDFTVIVVADVFTMAAAKRVIDKNLSSGFWMGRNPSTAGEIGSGILESAPPYGAFHAFTNGNRYCLLVAREGTTGRNWLNGSQASRTVSSTALNSDAIVIGDSVAGTDKGIINFYEMIVVGGKISSGNWTEINAYLLAEYGVSF